MKTVFEKYSIFFYSLVLSTCMFAAMLFFMGCGGQGTSGNVPRGPGGPGGPSGSGSCLSVVDCDGDGLVNSCDSAPADASVTAPVASNACDLDRDGYAGFDCGDYSINADGSLDRTGTAAVERLSRRLCDNCPTLANADQLDSDRDGTGDACVNATGTNTGTSGVGVTGTNFSNVLFVDGSLTEDVPGQDGTYAKPYRSLSQAVGQALASNPRKDVYVYTGSFAPVNVETVTVTGDVAIQGGYYCTDASGNAVSSIDCPEGTVLLRDARGQPTVIAAAGAALSDHLFKFQDGSRASLDGFRVTGPANGAYAAVNVLNASPTLSNNQFETEIAVSAAQQDGQVIRIEATDGNAAAPVIRDSTLTITGTPTPRSLVGISALANGAGARLAPVVEGCRVSVGRVQAVSRGINIHRSHVYFGAEYALPRIAENTVDLASSENGQGIAGVRSALDAQRNTVLIQGAAAIVNVEPTAAGISVSQAAANDSKVFNNLIQLTDLAVAGYYSGINAHDSSLLASNNTVHIEASGPAPVSAGMAITLTGTVSGTVKQEIVNNLILADILAGSDNAGISLVGSSSGTPLLVSHNLFAGTNNILTHRTMMTANATERRATVAFLEGTCSAMGRTCRGNREAAAASDVNVTPGTFQPTANSSTKDAGDESVTPLITNQLGSRFNPIAGPTSSHAEQNVVGNRDLSGSARVSNCRVDIGAYEFQDPAGRPFSECTGIGLNPRGNLNPIR